MKRCNCIYEYSVTGYAPAYFTSAERVVKTSHFANLPTRFTRGSATNSKARAGIVKLFAAIHM